MAPEKSGRKDSGVHLSGYDTPRRQSYPDRCVTPGSRSSTPSLPGCSSTPLRTRSTTPSRMDRSSTPLMTRSTTPCLMGRNSTSSLLPCPVTPSLQSQLSRPSTPSRSLSAPSRRGSLSLLPPRSPLSTPSAPQLNIRPRHSLPSGSLDPLLARRWDSTPSLEVVSACQECRNVARQESIGTHDAAGVSILCFYSEYWALACWISLRCNPQSPYKGTDC